MLCTLCEQLFGLKDVYTSVDGNIVSPYEQLDTLPACPKITASADQGCQFCATLIHSIRKRWPLDKETTTCTLRIGPLAQFMTGGYLRPGEHKEEDEAYILQVQVEPRLGYANTFDWELFARQGSDIATRLNIKRVAPSIDRTDADCAQLLRRWVTDCATTHSACRQESALSLPTRVIDVGISNETHLRLVMSNGEERVYVALSHCWGPPVPGSQLLRTTSVNIEAMHNDILLECMPQNFQDAVTVTRMLGLRYLWIDCLCIIQDSKEDWEKEGAKMGDIYRNAHVTIAATSAESSEDAFLKYKLLDARTVVSFPANSPSAEVEELVLQETNTTMSHWEPAVENTIWNDRGWTLQERFLSRRIIHFSSHQIWWECQTNCLSETGEIVSRTYLIPPKPRSWSPVDEHIGSAYFLEKQYNWWYKIVRQYSTRKLTYPSDKLPGLSGLAAKMQSLTAPYFPDRYLCGIWERDLAHGLLWRYGIRVNPKYHPPRAPSWSWAKCDSEVTWNTKRSTTVGESEIQMTSADVEIPGANPYGEIEQARLNLRAKIVAVNLHGPGDNPARTSDAFYLLFFPFDLRVPGSMDVVAFGALDHDEDHWEEIVYCLQIEKQLRGVSAKEYHPSGLLLRKVDAGSNDYHRIGVFTLLEDYLDLFEDEKAQMCALV